MVRRVYPVIGLSMPNGELRTFAREQADQFFAGNLSRYIASLIELDRVRGITRDEFVRKLGALADEREAVLA